MSPALLGGISSAFRINPFTGTHLVVRRAHGAIIESTDGSRVHRHVHGSWQYCSRTCAP